MVVVVAVGDVVVAVVVAGGRGVVLAGVADVVVDMVVMCFVCVIGVVVWSLWDQ